LSGNGKVTKEEERDCIVICGDKNGMLCSAHIGYFTLYHNEWHSIRPTPMPCFLRRAILPK